MTEDVESRERRVNRGSVLEILELSARYPGGGDVLRDVSLSVGTAEVVCAIGESGCGKSTLLKAILRMPGGVEISGGRILFNGLSLSGLSREEIRRVRGAGIGMVYQEPGSSMDPIRKIGAQFYEVMRSHGEISRKEAARSAGDLFSRMGLPNADRILKSCPVQLSGGMNQRVAIALAMALRPKILLADEPTSSLDVTTQAQIMDELLRLRDEYGAAILMVTHNIGAVARMADTVAVMYGGRVVEYGGRDEVLNSPSHPYTRALIASIPKLDGTPPRGIPGAPPKQCPPDGCAFAPRCSQSAECCASRKMERAAIHTGHWTLCHGASRA
jgi:peptide/nickel transport system ATP-binding protein